MSPHEELFHRLLDESSALLAAPGSRGIAIPDDELHSEIIVPLLPAMLADTAIRQHWNEQAATGFVARLARHFDCGEPAPRWLPADFEIHVTASYSAGPDARALADTLLSENSLRDLTAALMNHLRDALWSSFALAPIAPLSEPIKTPATPAIEALPIASEPEILEQSLLLSQHPLSCALVRTLCRKLGAPLTQRTLVLHRTHTASATIIARRILRRASSTALPCRATSPRQLPRRALL